MSPAARAVAVLFLLLSTPWQVTAEEVEKRFRFGLSVGGFNTRDEVRSSSANTLFVIDEDGEIAARLLDPRDDAAANANFEIQSGTIGTLSLQYAVTRTVVLEGSVGYNENDVGEIEIQELGAGIFRMPAGELTRVPVQFTTLLRFRPHARFNPYFGGGFGYEFIGFEPSAELDQLSLNLDAATGRQGIVIADSRGSGVFIFVRNEPIQLEGATVDANDAWEWHIAGGAEYSVGARWSLIFDLRYTSSSGSFRLQFNGEDELGIGVPQGRADVGSDLATGDYGPMVLFPGGLLDLDGDGEVDSGFYYARGGELNYDGISAQIGVRYTF